MNCKVEAKAMVNPTEDMEKVIEALSNVLDFDELIINEDQVIISGEKSCLQPIKDTLESRKIQETARKILMNGIKNNKIYFKLSKQAAFAGKINLLNEELSTLGEIEVVVECENPEEFIEWICI